jgi:transposase
MSVNTGRSTASTRPADVRDAEWLCQLLEAGLLRASFVPPKPIRALCHGTTDPELLADLAKGKLRKKIPALRQALEGRFEPLHALLVSSILPASISSTNRSSGSRRRSRSSYALSSRRLSCCARSTGSRPAPPRTILAEIGADTTVFPSADQLASWAGQCPGNDQSAGKRKSGKTRTGSKWLNDVLKDAAMAAIRTNDSYPQAQYQRPRPRYVGHGRALQGSDVLERRHGMCLVGHIPARELTVHTLRFSQP